MRILRKKYTCPRHPWRLERIKNENLLQQRYGLKNKREIWKALYLLSKWRKNARRLLVTGEEKEREQLLNKLENLGLLKERSLSAVLNLTINDVLERRLQTIVYRKNLALSMRQSRNLISHKHIRLNGRVLNVPGYLVKKDEEEHITCDIPIIQETQQQQLYKQSQQPTQQSNIQIQQPNTKPNDIMENTK